MWLMNAVGGPTWRGERTSARRTGSPPGPRAMLRTACRRVGWLYAGTSPRAAARAPRAFRLTARSHTPHSTGASSGPSRQPHLLSLWTSLWGREGIGRSG